MELARSRREATDEIDWVVVVEDADGASLTAASVGLPTECGVCTHSETWWQVRGAYPGRAALHRHRRAGRQQGRAAGHCPYLLYGPRRSMPARAGLRWAPAPQHTPPWLKRCFFGMSLSVKFALAVVLLKLALKNLLPIFKNVHMIAK